MGIDVLDRAGGMLVAGAGDLGIHIILGEADFSSDLVRMDLSPADQIVNGGLTDMENVSHFLGRQRLVLRHRFNS